MYKEPHMHFCIVFLTLFGHRPFPQRDNDTREISSFFNIDLKLSIFLKFHSGRIKYTIHL